MKTKDFALSVKDAEEDGTFEGYGSTFGGAPDSYGDIVMPGAFAESLVKHKRDGSMPLMLFGHKASELPIGSWLDMAEDGKGLWVKGQIDIEDSLGVRVHRALKRKSLRGLSIGYDVKASEPDEKKPGVTRLTVLDLWEVSVVNFPANKRSRVETIKSEEEAAEKWAKFEDWVRRVCDDEVPPPSEFEDILRDARASKSRRALIASRMHAVLRRSESDGVKANDLAALRSAVAAFSPT